MKKLWKKDAPIINSMLEVDAYKYTMLYFIYKFFPELEVTFTFKNRNPDIKLGKTIDIAQLHEELQHVQSLSISENQLNVLRSWKIFPEDFILALKTIRLPEQEITKAPDGQLQIEVRGLWFDTTLWELFDLPILSELNTRSQITTESDQIRAIREGESRLFQKIEMFRSLKWKIALFGLRRRATGLWERHVTDILLNEIPGHISGTSNIQIADEFGIEAIGTNAHELAMALYALRRWESDFKVWQSQYEVLKKWQTLFGHNLLIILPDTFGSSQFYDKLPPQYLYDWRGSRQDSGDPLEYGERMIDRYKQNRINPQQKLVFFTDGLNPQKMLEIEKRFLGRIGGGFGVGTNISNDIGIKVVPMVMKLTEAAHKPAVKLSDNLAKAIGPDQEIARAKDIFGYTNKFREECVY